MTIRILLIFVTMQLSATQVFAGAFSKCLPATRQLAIHLLTTPMHATQFFQPRSPHSSLVARAPGTMESQIDRERSLDPRVIKAIHEKFDTYKIAHSFGDIFAIEIEGVSIFLSKSWVTKEKESEMLPVLHIKWIREKTRDPLLIKKILNYLVERARYEGYTAINVPYSTPEPWTDKTYVREAWVDEIYKSVGFEEGGTRNLWYWIPSTLDPATSETVEAYLTSGVRAQWIDTGDFRFYLSRGDRKFQSWQRQWSVSTLEIVNITSKNPGSGKYRQLLALLGKKARDHKIEALYAEGVKNDRQKKFYKWEEFEQDPFSGLIGHSESFIKVFNPRELLKREPLHD